MNNKIEQIKQIIASSLLALLGILLYNHFFSENDVKTPETKTVQTFNLEEKLKNRIYFQGKKIKGSISTKGCTLDFLQLKDFNEKKQTDQKITLLYPEGSKKESVIKTIFSGTNAPSENEHWSKVGNSYNWSNNQWKINQKYTIQDYTIRLNIEATNIGKNSATIGFSNTLTRAKPKEESSFGYEGAYLGGANQYIKKGLDSKSLSQSKFNKHNFNGWMGVSDKYWLVAKTVSNQEQIECYEENINNINLQKYHTSEKQMTVKPKETYVKTYSFYIGPKSLHALKQAESQTSTPGLMYSIDYGWFKIITKPLFEFLTIIIAFLGTPALGILAFILLCKLAYLPLTARLKKSTKAMKQIQPEIAKIQEQYKDSPQLIQQKTLEVYRKYKVNPVSGCLPVILQITLFFPIYRALNLLFELRMAPFFFWIKDLSSPDPTNWMNLFGLLPYEVNSIFSFGLWPLIMGLSFYIQQRDPNNKHMGFLLLIISIFMSSSVPVVITIFWSILNISSIVYDYIYKLVSKK